MTSISIWGLIGLCCLCALLGATDAQTHGADENGEKQPFGSGGKAADIMFGFVN